MQKHQQISDLFTAVADTATAAPSLPPVEIPTLRWVVSQAYQLDGRRVILTTVWQGVILLKCEHDGVATYDALLPGIQRTNNFADFITQVARLK